MVEINKLEYVGITITPVCYDHTNDKYPFFIMGWTTGDAVFVARFRDMKAAQRSFLYRLERGCKVSIEYPRGKHV